MVLFIVLYIVLAALSAALCYWDRIHMPYEYQIDYGLDGVVSVAFGLSFPITMPFWIALFCVRKLIEREDNE